MFQYGKNIVKNQKNFSPSAFIYSERNCTHIMLGLSDLVRSKLCDDEATCDAEVGQSDDSIMSSSHSKPPHEDARIVLLLLCSTLNFGGVPLFIV